MEDDRDRLIAALRTPHEWDLDQRKMTASLAGVTIEFGGKLELFELFKQFVDGASRMTIRDWLPEKAPSETLGVGALHRNLNRLRALLQERVGLTINADRNTLRPHSYYLYRADTGKPIAIHRPKERE